MTVVDKPFTNGAYGFPRAKERRIRPVALACIHITGNSRTAAYTDLHKAALAEWTYANRDRDFDTADPDYGPTAHRYVARDGWRIAALDWKRYAAWSNGDVSNPNTANAGVGRVLAMRAKGYNANEAYWLEFENVGWGSTWPITRAQQEAIAADIAEASRYSGLPINRETVHGHWEINGVDRSNCPSPQHEAFLNEVIELARGTAQEDTVGLATTLDSPLVAGKLRIPKGTRAINVETGLDYSVPIDATRDAVKARLTGAFTGPGFYVDLDGDRLHFVRSSFAGVVFTPDPDPVAQPDPAVLEAARKEAIAAATPGIRVEEYRRVTEQTTVTFPPAP